MKRFLKRHADQVSGVLSGFDRLRFRGTMRWLAYADGMRSFLSCAGVLLKDFQSYVQGVTGRIREAAERLAAEADRPLVYLNSSAASKEELARTIAERDGVREGLVCVLSAVESCYSYEVHRSRERRLLELRSRPQKCLHYYFYLEDPTFGFMHVRLQTWFPLNVHVAINGREWLGRQLARAGIDCRRADNCFLELADLQEAQRLADAQLATRWKEVFDKLIAQVHPVHRQLLYAGKPIEYYWSLEQSEWATDLMFRSPQELARFYPAWLRRGLDFTSPEVMRFLGKKTPKHGGVNGHFAGDVVSDVGRRADHVRIKHRLGGNWIKMYDKHGAVLRVETTLNDVRGMKVFRRAEGDACGKRLWRSLRKGVADVKRRAQISEAANHRYLDALAEVNAPESLAQLVDALCRPAELNGRRVRALHPWSPEDSRLLAAVNRPEFAIAGFRNRDLRPLLFDARTASPEEARREGAKVTRQLRMLRAHGLILKVPHTHRYHLTASGRKALTALQAARQASAEQLAQLAA
ncbi:MAG TPA: hypothetical protein VFV87_02970 [Pirellulaceae bacterium]|nr:hypothetical protein [Pirellulaceae bacterium]